jgi:hypothetical protein
MGGVRVTTQNLVVRSVDTERLGRIFEKESSKKYYKSDLLQSVQIEHLL